MPMMDFASQRDRVRRLIANKKPSQQSRSTLTPDPLRDNIIEEEGIQTERFKSAINRKPEIEYEVEGEDGTKEQRSFVWDGYGDALKDVAKANFSFSDPQLQSPENILASRQLNRELLNDYMRSESFDESRPYTQGNSMESVWGSLAYGKSLQESAETRLAEHIARSEQMAEQEQEQQSAEDMLEQLRDRAREQSKGGGRPERDVRKGINRALRQIAKAGGAIHGLLDQQAQSTFAADVRAANKAAADAAEEAVEGMSLLPGMEPGMAHNLTADQQLALAEKWAANDELRKIAKMLGRMYRDMRFKRKARQKGIPEMPVGVSVGADLERLLPHEMVRATHPVLLPGFIKDFAEHALLQYEVEGDVPAGKGPIVCVVDGSGSMSGEPFIWASSVELSLFKISFAAVEFGSSGQMKMWLFPKGKVVDPNEVFDMASHFFGGGTDTCTGMAEALRICQDEEGYKTADVVLIGDGQDHFEQADQDVRDRLHALGVRIHGITIETGENPYFEQMCEWHVDVAEIALAGANDATDALAEQIT
jgi:uncharacterized protein with von Willebrand factor type A (vWA) domain